MQKSHGKRHLPNHLTVAQQFTSVPLTSDLKQNEKHFKYGRDYLGGWQLMKGSVRAKCSRKHSDSLLNVHKVGLRTPSQASCLLC